MSLGKISILMPFKNTESYLEECLESILKQTYEDWELISVDDHSSDNSRQLVEAYGHKDNRIKSFSNRGQGIIAALRHSYQKSSGEFITRMDSDDIMFPEKLATLSRNLHESGRGNLAVGQVKYFSEYGISDGYARYEKWINGLTAKGENYNEIYKECVVPSPCWMVYRSDLDKIRAFKPDRYPEDYDLTFRFYQHGLKCIPCNKVLHRWRDYPSRTSRTSEHYAQNYFLDIKIDYFLKLDHDSCRPLTVWGAGFKGKTIARKLKERQCEFHWLCDNPKKIGKKIYGVELKPYQFLETLEKPQSIVTVANEDSQSSIRAYFKILEMSEMSDYFFFC